MRTKTPEAEIGVIVGRFQVPDLHEGHLEMINAVREQHRKVLILVGSTPGILVTRNNPLDYHTRMLMLREAYPDISIMPVNDMPNDDLWSEMVDEKIHEAFGIGGAILYGSRDGFIPYYTGKHPVIELEETRSISGTEIRKAISDEVRVHSEFRRGVVYAAFNKHPVMYATVDIAVIDFVKHRIVLGRKKGDLTGKYRFPGGFVDPRKDKALEHAARREAREELDCEISQVPEFVGSTLIDDWRYRSELDKIMTSVFIAQYIYGSITGSDDLSEAKWFSLEDFDMNVLLPQHRVIMEMVQTHLNKGLEK